MTDLSKFFFMQWLRFFSYLKCSPLPHNALVAFWGSRLISTCIDVLMTKIRRSHDSLIHNGSLQTWKDHLYIETGPWCFQYRTRKNTSQTWWVQICEYRYVRIYSANNNQKQAPNKSAPTSGCFAHQSPSRESALEERSSWILIFSPIKECNMLVSKRIWDFINL